MDHRADDRERHVSGAGVLGGLDSMVAAGRVTEDEAAGIREAAAGRVDEVVQQIRARHAKARVEAAVEAGRLTREAADAIVERLDGGEDPRFVLDLRLGSAGA